MLKKEDLGNNIPHLHGQNLTFGLSGAHLWQKMPKFEFPGDPKTQKQLIN